MGDVSPILPDDEGQTVDAHARKTLIDVEARLLRLEKSVARIARTQAKNLPIFKDVVSRITIMRESIHAQAQGLSRVEKIATDSAAVTTALAETVRVISTAQTEVNEKLDTILSLFTHAKTWGGYARKYGSKAVPFVLGILVSNGLLDGKLVEGFLAIFS